MPVQIQLRNDTASNWTTANPVLALGEFGLERNTGQFKIGNGTSTWNALPYGGIVGPTGAAGADGVDGDTGPQGPPGELSNLIATSPILYNSETSTLSLNQSLLTIAQSQVTGLVSDLAAKANSSDLTAKANLNSPTFTGTVAGITATMVGLGNVDNTSDANKPVSTATQTALNLKANLASPTFTGNVSFTGATVTGITTDPTPQVFLLMGA
jgi:hypothetical protein